MRAVRTSRVRAGSRPTAPRIEPAGRRAGRPAPWAVRPAYRTGPAGRAAKPELRTELAEWRAGERTPPLRRIGGPAPWAAGPEPRTEPA